MTNTFGDERRRYRRLRWALIVWTAVVLGVTGGVWYFSDIPLWVKILILVVAVGFLPSWRDLTQSYEDYSVMHRELLDEFENQVDPGKGAEEKRTSY